jgi:lysine 6-dehydrogenase
MKSAIVLGAGMVGSVMAADLARDPGWRVTVADLRAESLEAAAGRVAAGGAPVTTVRADLSDASAVRRAVEAHDLVLGALPSALGFAALRAVIEAGKDCCDISFMGEDPLELDGPARERGVTVVVDCGVAPGMSHLIAGYEASRLRPCERLDIYVGGLPRERRWPFQYKAAFAPSDVLEEYTRPARCVEGGRVVTREALGEPEPIDFPGIGTLEGVLTDGLRSLTRTLRVPSMREKTLRYPGHSDLMRAFRETGLFSTDPVEVAGARVRPRDLTAALLFPKWTYRPGEEDLTVMRVVAEGTLEGRRVRSTWDLFDAYDRASGVSSMARVTAFPCTVVGRMIASGRVKGPGVLAPEHLGQRAGVLDEVLAALEQRGVRFGGRFEPVGS